MFKSLQSILILHFTPSLHFTLTLQSAFYPWSAVCSPQSAFYTDRLISADNGGPVARGKEPFFDIEI